MPQYNSEILSGIFNLNIGQIIWDIVIIVACISLLLSIFMIIMKKGQKTSMPKSINLNIAVIGFLTGLLIIIMVIINLNSESIKMIMLNNFRQAVSTQTEQPNSTISATDTQVALVSSPTIAPDANSASLPSITPTQTPSPTITVTATPKPTQKPTHTPTPTVAPTPTPTVAPTPTPTVAPTPTPTVAPTPTPPQTIAVTGVTLSDTSRSVTPGGSFSLTATVSPLNATNKNVTWSSSNSGVVSVSGGTVTINGATTAVGTYTVTVRTAEGNYTANCTVTIKLWAPSGLHCNYTNRDTVEVEWNNVNGAASYKVYFNGSLVGGAGTNIYTKGSLSPNTEYIVKVYAVDVNGGVGFQSDNLTTRTQS